MIFSGGWGVGVVCLGLGFFCFKFYSNGSINKMMLFTSNFKFY